MSKKAKAAAKEKNLQKKRAIKAANKAKYQAWALAGNNSKSKRSISRNKKAKKRNGISHPDGPCGNIGCRMCNPGNIIFFDPFS